MTVTLEELDDAAYWRTVAALWSLSDSCSADIAKWRGLLTADRPGREHMTGAEGLAQLAAMPSVLTVYRGYDGQGIPDGLAWTLDRAIAVSYAHRTGREGATVVTGRLRRADVIAYLTADREAEVLALPEDVFFRREDPA